MRISRVYTGDDGQSHFEDIDVAFPETMGLGKRTEQESSDDRDRLHGATTSLRRRSKDENGLLVAGSVPMAKWSRRASGS